jgi:hypothetical protein
MDRKVLSILSGMFVIGLNWICCAQDEEWAERVGRMGAAAAGERPWPGCTAIVLLVHAGHLYVANAGDCRAVLCRQVCMTGLIWRSEFCLS